MFPSRHVSDRLPFAETSTTPPGSPPTNLAASLREPSAVTAGLAATAAAPAAQNSQSILDALANLARQNTSAPPGAPAAPATPAAPGVSAPPALVPSYNMPPTGLPQPVSSSVPQAVQPPPQPAASYLPTSQPPASSAPSLPFSLPQMPGQKDASAPAYPPNPQFPGAGGPSGNLALDPQQQQQLLLVKALADQGVPFDKIPALLQGLTAAGVPGAAGQPPAPPAGVPGAAPQPAYGSGQPSWGAQGANPDEPRDWRGGYNGGVDSPGNYGRSRSRSPDRGWGGRSPRGGRDRGDYGRNSPRSRDGGRRGGDYRNRSPPRRRGQSPPPTEKWVDHDPTLPSGSIKVLSRTLFIGGVT